MAIVNGNGNANLWLDNSTPYTHTMVTFANQRLFSVGAGGTLQTQMYITSSGNLQFGGPWSDGFAWGASAGTWYHVIYRADTAGTTQNVGHVLDGSTINNKN